MRTNNPVHALRLEELLREEMDRLLRDEIHDPVIEAIQVVRVQVAAGGSNVNIHYASALAERETREPLERVAAFLRRELCEALPRKRCAVVRFSRVNMPDQGGEP